VPADRKPRNAAGATGDGQDQIDLAVKVDELSGEVQALRAEVARRDRALADRVVDRLNLLTAQVDGLRAELSR
jgi:uncharacterized small protein (DUF1192 family)